MNPVPVSTSPPPISRKRAFSPLLSLLIGASFAWLCLTSPSCLPSFCSKQHSRTHKSREHLLSVILRPRRRANSPSFPSDLNARGCVLPFLGYTVLGSEGSLSARFKVLIFFHPHEGKRLHFKTETGDLFYFRGSGICGKHEIAQRTCEEEREI